RVEVDPFLGQVFYFEKGALFGSPSGPVFTHNTQGLYDFRAKLAQWATQAGASFDALPASQKQALRDQFTADTTGGLGLWGGGSVGQFFSGLGDKVVGLGGGVWETVKQIVVGFATGTGNAIGTFVGHLEQSITAFGSGDVYLGFRDLVGSVGMLVR